MSYTRSFIGSGTIYLRRRGVANAALAPIGNCSKLTLTIADESKSQQNYEGGGGTIAKVTRIKSVVAAINADSFSAENIAVGVRGTVDSVTSVVAIAGEAHADIVEGSLIVTERLPDLTKPLTVKVGATVINEAGNYERKRVGIFVQAGAADLANGDDITIDYTPLPEDVIEALTETGMEYELVFDGLNEADSGKPVVVEGFRAQFSPAKTLDLLGDNFGSLPLEAEFLADDSIVGTGLSRFFRVRAAQ